MSQEWRKTVPTSGTAIAATVEAAFERAVPGLMHEWNYAVRDAARAAAATCDGLLSTGEDQLRRNYDGEPCNGPRPATMTAGRRRRKVRQDISIGDKNQIVHLQVANSTWPVVLQQLPVPVSMRDAQKITAHAAVYREMPNDARTMRRNNRRVGKWPELDTVVYE